MNSNLQQFSSSELSEQCCIPSQTRMLRIQAPVIIHLKSSVTKQARLSVENKHEHNMQLVKYNDLTKYVRILSLCILMYMYACACIYIIDINYYQLNFLYQSLQQFSSSFPSSQSYFPSHSIT